MDFLIQGHAILGIDSNWSAYQTKNSYCPERACLQPLAPSALDLCMHGAYRAAGLPSITPIPDPLSIGAFQPDFTSRLALANSIGIGALLLDPMQSFPPPLRNCAYRCRIAYAALCRSTSLCTHLHLLAYLGPLSFPFVL